jgi:hypothetical protein
MNSGVLASVLSKVRHFKDTASSCLSSKLQFGCYYIAPVKSCCINALSITSIQIPHPRDGELRMSDNAIRRFLKPIRDRRYPLQFSRVPKFLNRHFQGTTECTIQRTHLPHHSHDALVSDSRAFAMPGYAPGIRT